MKKLLFALMIILLPMMAIANVNLGIKKADEFIVMPLLTLDSAGVDRAPDSIQILTWLDGGTALQFSTRNTTYPFSAISIDTSKIFADTTSPGCPFFGRCSVAKPACEQFSPPLKELTSSHSYSCIH